jgi:hypothetical protein
MKCWSNSNDPTPIENRNLPQEQTRVPSFVTLANNRDMCPQIAHGDGKEEGPRTFLELYQ